MNAKEYRVYREEQEHIERKNRQSVQENALVSAVCPTKNVIKLHIKRKRLLLEA